MRNEINQPIEKIIHRCLNPSGYDGRLNIPSGYLRISITDHCNMNCDYCHNEGQKEKNTSFLSIDDLRYIASKTLQYGLAKIKLTGGEPLLHPDCQKMVRMLKRDLSIPHVGLNTNGIFFDRLLPIVSDGLLDDIVVGVDYAENPISKKSQFGVSSKEILNNVLKLKKLIQNVSIACVYDGNKERLANLVNWSLQHEVVLKILEVSDDKIYSGISQKFISMIEYILERFSLKLGMIDTLSEYFGMIANEPNVFFFHSHCRLRECDICALIHIRVTSRGRIKSCILNKIEYPLLPPGDFDNSISKVIHDIGHTPEYFMQG
ncbi:cyclic pyranopterin phosphate synthase [Spirochaetia bacterium]|nr:cyclic pyranopterin phosphate synthase [Spirochaetia bacterium]